jgi:hypothetical protein
VAIGYVGKAFAMNAVAVETAAVPMPSTVAAGHKLYALVGSIGAASGTVTPPSGWTRVLDEITGTSLRTILYAKTAVAADAGATHTWKFPNTGRTFGYAVAYSGVDTAAANLAQANSFTDTGNGPWATPALALGAGDWLLTAGVGRQNPGTSGTHDWTTTTVADVARFDLYTDVAPSIILSAALWDTGAPVAAGSAARTLNSNVNYSQAVVWSARVPALADTGGSAGGGNPWSHMGIPLR